MANSLIVDAIDGIRVVKLGNAADRLLSKFNGLLRRHHKFGIRYGVLAELPASSVEVVVMIPLIVVVWISSQSVRFPLPPAMLAGLVLAFARIKSPVQLLVQAVILLSANLRKLEVIDEILTRLATEQSELNGEIPKRPIPSVIERIRLEGVTFGYQGRREAVLLDVTFSCRRGEVTAIVGPTGAGKTTIADLLARLYEPQSGMILENDTDILQTNIISWRSQIGYVGQDCFLFNATLRENITMWDGTISQERLEQAARAAQLEQFIASLPEGYAAVVGDRGVKLSGGQRQRVAIVRALVYHPQILLFDEATSALDNLTEKAVHEAIASLRRNAIVVLIAHRMSTVRDADRIVVLDHGRVLEQGRHDELLGLKGCYWKLCEAAKTEARMGETA